MPAIAAIALTDGRATPIVHTFAPKSTNGSKSRHINTASGVTLAAAELLTLEVVEPVGPNGAHRVIGSLVQPVEVTDSGGNYVVDYSNKFNFDFNFSRKSSAAIRKDLAYMVGDLLTEAVIRSMVENLEPQY